MFFFYIDNRNITEEELISDNNNLNAHNFEFKMKRFLNEFKHKEKTVVLVKKQNLFSIINKILLFYSGKIEFNDNHKLRLTLSFFYELRIKNCFNLAYFVYNKIKYKIMSFLIPYLAIRLIIYSKKKNYHLLKFENSIVLICLFMRSFKSKIESSDYENYKIINLKKEKKKAPNCSYINQFSLVFETMILMDNFNDYIFYIHFLILLKLYVYNLFYSMIIFNNLFYHIELNKKEILKFLVSKIKNRNVNVFWLIEKSDFEKFTMMLGKNNDINLRIKLYQHNKFFYVMLNINNCFFFLCFFRNYNHYASAFLLLKIRFKSDLYHKKIRDFYKPVWLDVNLCFSKFFVQMFQSLLDIFNELTLQHRSCFKFKSKLCEKRQLVIKTQNFYNNSETNNQILQFQKKKLLRESDSDPNINVSYISEVKSLDFDKMISKPEYNREDIYRNMNLDFEDLLPDQIDVQLNQNKTKTNDFDLENNYEKEDLNRFDTLNEMIKCEKHQEEKINQNDDIKTSNDSSFIQDISKTMKSDKIEYLNFQITSNNHSVTDIENDDLNNMFNEDNDDNISLNKELFSSSKYLSIYSLFFNKSLSVLEKDRLKYISSNYELLNISDDDLSLFPLIKRNSMYSESDKLFTTKKSDVINVFEQSDNLKKKERKNFIINENQMFTFFNVKKKFFQKKILMPQVLMNFFPKLIKCKKNVFFESKKKDDVDNLDLGFSFLKENVDNAIKKKKFSFFKKNSNVLISDNSLKHNFLSTKDFNDSKKKNQKSKMIIENNDKTSRIKENKLTNLVSSIKSCNKNLQFSKVSFSLKIVLYYTYSDKEYDRYSDFSTFNHLNFELATQIKKELNIFKREMIIHPDSNCFTHYFKIF